MSLIITDHFEYNSKLGTYDFTKESKNISALRSLPSFKDFQVGNLPLTIIAYREYGDHNLWWVLAAYNNIIMVDEFPDLVIKIPLLTDVRRVLQ